MQVLLVLQLLLQAMMNPEHLDRKEGNLEPVLAKQAHSVFTHNFYFFMVVGKGCILPGHLLS